MHKKLIDTYKDINFIFLDTVNSTNTYCKEIYEKGFTKDTIVISDTQLDGKGTKGRKWNSPKGKGLWFSLLLKPHIELKDINFLTILTSTALHNTFLDFGIDTKIKWPNDIYLNSKKLSGILTESKISDNKIEYLIIGIGINVNLELTDFNYELKNIATSLLITTGTLFNREDILIKFLDNFYEQYNELLNGNKNNILTIYKNNSLILNKEVSLEYKNSTRKVTPIDILEDGSLLVRNLNREVEKIVSGEISLRL
ncbi:biotin--[acetyl-CoA-carboxylase] ligase [Clostridium sp. AL.422]|uniref:biotin--[acetyl-CoA-carboxylase] ligase n=1 Tax=Clostridium TaxID=1485 RepID=UPI00293DD3DD|nr:MULTISPECIES: biotin--[acetyl-CoA-carboxylase] ligase [unclassified Clostridium]MDV4151540.1 biotin--[acetyl-CoA-carboxylase] ligase [Clostridium sp. AL.422]